MKALTEQLAHELRALPNCRVSAHLLVPGFTFTGITGRGAEAAGRLDAGAGRRLHAGQSSRGATFISSARTMTSRASMDERRMQWAADDLIKNRPALSRWHPDYKTAFDAFMSDNKRQP